MVSLRSSSQLDTGFAQLELSAVDDVWPLDRGGGDGFELLLSSMFADPAARAATGEMYYALTGSAPPPDDEYGSEAVVADVLAEAARRGQLRARPRPTLTRTGKSRERELPALREAARSAAVTDTWFEIRVIDEVGAAVAGLGLVIELGGALRSETTDGDGRVRITAPTTASSATAELVSVDRARKLVHPRWRRPRTPVVPVGTEDAPVHERTLGHTVAPVPMRRERVTTLVLRPCFDCRAITATTFEFGRSFPRREGIAALAEIAVALAVHDGVHAWIFGHTDRAGDELLNKQLSERRAEAVLALLTHDAAIWERLWQGRTRSGGHERWGVRELQHMLATLGCHDDEGRAPVEDGRMGPRTRAAIAHFQRGEDPGGADRAGLVDDGEATTETLRELFLAYARLVTLAPVDDARIDPIGDARSMGCGEFNPLSWAARDRESRRTVVFLFDPAARPDAPPCKLGTLAPCHARLAAPPERGASGPFSRCSFYRGFACCDGKGGEDRGHDVLVRLLVNPRRAHDLPHRFVLEADDDGVAQTASPSFRDSHDVARDARAVLDARGKVTAMVELEFAHVPAASSYRLRVEGVEAPYTVFAHTKYDAIGKVAGAACVAARTRVVIDALFDAAR